MSRARPRRRAGRGRAAAEPPLGVLLDAAYYFVNRRIVAHLHAAGYPEVRPAHAKVFENIGSGRRLTDLAERAQVTKQSMAELVQTLAHHGLVTRVPDPSDGRARIVQLTARGQEVVAAAEEALAALYSTWRRVLGRQRFHDLERALRDVLRSEDDSID